MSEKNEIGSFFHNPESSNLIKLDINDFISNYQLFYTGRQAIKYLIDMLSLNQKVDTIWLPKYYCQHVTAWLKENYSNIAVYDINPFETNEKLDESFYAKFGSNDIVVLNNFWGLSDYIIPCLKNRALFIEDHSHGWLSPNCINSNADYCFASLRKTLPIPLGGICWKPNGVVELIDDLQIVDSDFYVKWDDNVEAMSLKKDYLLGDNDSSKEKFLSLITDTEKYLHNHYQIVTLKKEHKSIVEKYLSFDYNKPKRNNLDILVLNLIKTENFKVIEKGDIASFGLNLIFKDKEYFNSLKMYLISNAIYPSELWPDNVLTSDYKYLLNIHIDFRYSEKQMVQIFTVINKWITDNV
ncbi:hypothetical protein KO500_09830 [Cellulophaga baltica]|uniref:hypothetical protein n=1 Tax=Cellulophaga TaxID=104264 RepID=UPI001C065F05|nr:MULTISPECIES: hypothetical protein [Cellulophaga]MBU2996735.1 hypothetical protein [Cellulophaga baltica]MDO6768131.1 hypothetical protein [Cellulophaga sp. 1_MG-2023]